MRLFQSESEIESLIEKFNTCNLPAEDWTHEAHLAMGVWYLRQYNLTQSMHLVRQRIILFNSSVGGPINFERGYHETLTWFWLKTVEAFLDRFGREKTLLEACNAFLSSEYALRDRALLFYEKEEVMSLEARAFLVLPTNTSRPF
ncbi:hypothetical protein [Arcicella lustrica]|uniref:Uncharacterized protein n=1 Tax=Arcicella lustrica TaxID=2984196 RepID=A0ABU5SET1_9BACT|nr:hypothetical protein [Arcicella sp. DC25W]MEA5425790.1 hypothetical protein [Arcicella sp. DC25W]